ncbi:hypothetical protein [Gallaecimonas sp. GXIMD1310]|uniref:hypothetical protein n=1 Tax=Gallaecimonas sp. GXIMD1310 TaxID=3131926 RepID=UPI003252706C
MTFLRFLLYLMILAGLDYQLGGGWHWPTALTLAFIFVAVLLEWLLGLRAGQHLGQLQAAEVKKDQLLLHYPELTLQFATANVQWHGGRYQVRGGPYYLQLAPKKLPQGVADILKRHFR